MAELKITDLLKRQVVSNTPNKLESTWLFKPPERSKAAEAMAVIGALGETSETRLNAQVKMVLILNGFIGKSLNSNGSAM